MNLGGSGIAGQRGDENSFSPPSGCNLATQLLPRLRQPTTVVYSQVQPPRSSTTHSLAGWLAAPRHA